MSTDSANLAFIYHPVFDGRGFSRLSDSWRRYALARRQLWDVGLLQVSGEISSGVARQVGPIVEHQAVEATDEEILLVHRPEHLAFIRKANARGTGFLDYGDTPAWPGVLRRARLAVGGTLLATRLVTTGSFRRAFNPAGGLHHARADRAGGFCPSGFGYNLNIPLERGTTADDYLAAFERWVVPAVHRYAPELIFYVVGADSHVADPLVHLGVTLPVYRQLACRMAELADDLCGGRLVAVAGGGYSPEHVARCWTVVLATLAGAWTEEDPWYRALVEEDRIPTAARTTITADGESVST
jgi:acetoin utilization deacetylase AcuC-like enzyme